MDGLPEELAGLLVEAHQDALVDRLDSPSAFSVSRVLRGRSLLVPTKTLPPATIGPP